MSHQPFGFSAAADLATAAQLDANKLHVYGVALELHALCSTLAEGLHHIVRDQLERASLSIILNIAEAMVPHCLRSTTFRRKETAGDGK